jgi:hypothetical protein
MILAVALLLIAQPDAGGWVEVSRNRQLTNYIDARSVRAIADRRLLRQRVVLATALPTGTVTAEYAVEISCDRRTIALWGGVERDRTGRVVRSRKLPRPSIISIAPNSTADRIFEYVCRR